MLNAERYILVKEIFLAASSRSPEERLSFLDEACGADLELRTEVESLLSYDDSAEAFMETPIFQGGPALHTSDIFATRKLDFGPVNIPPRPRPTRIGAYAIVDVLGEGGMGVVYLAEQDNPKRRAAIKVIKSGLATRDVLRRFEFEAQLLGRLQHPGIAQIFEAGTFDDGDSVRPFYAMEHIEGQPLNRYIEERRFDALQKIDLLIKVCEAVHHAHQKGIIHRDLKPGNVLVMADGMPKILDFGVARAVNADDRNTIQTGAGQLIGTISYMSPEQVSGNPDDLDTRSDVYALGVIGFEMLARALPHDFGRKQVAECARIIRDEEPRKLGEFDKSFHGDLETIFAKALEKDQSRRYQSASDLAADLRRFLKHEPISARPSSIAYRLRKRIERNPRTAVSGAILSLFAIAAIFVVAWVWWAKAASDQYASANRAAFKAIEESYYAALQTGDFDRHRASALESMLVKMDALAADTERRSPRKSIELYLSVAEGYRRLGMYGQEQTAAEHALALRQKISNRRDRDLADTLHELGKALWWNSNYAAAEQRHNESLEIRRRIFGDQSEPVAASLTHLAACAMRLGRLDQAEQLYRQVLAIRQGFPDSTKDKELMIGASLHNLAAALYTQGRFQEALGLYEQDMQLTGDPEIDRERLPRGLCNKAEALIDLGRFDEADKALSYALEIQSDRGLNQSLTARIRYQQARSLFKQGKIDLAEAPVREALDKLESVLVTDHLAISDVRLLLGRILLANGDVAGAEEYISGALAARDQRLPANHWLIADAQSALGELVMAQGHIEEAEPLLLQAHGRLAATRLRGDPYLSDSIDRLIRLYEQSNRGEEAQHWREIK